LGSDISEGRVGRAFSLHTACGFLGGAVTPGFMLGIASYAGMSWAMIAGGLIGPLVALPLLFAARRDAAKPRPATAASRPAEGSNIRRVLSPAVLAMMVFFITLALANGGIHSFSVAAWVGQGMSLELASAALTAYLFASALGVLVGGYIADWTKRHGLVATFGFIAAASVMLLIGNGVFQGYALVAAMISSGLLTGMIMPSRNSLTRRDGTSTFRCRRSVWAISINVCPGCKSRWLTKSLIQFSTVGSTFSSLKIIGSVVINSLLLATKLKISC